MNTGNILRHSNSNSHIRKSRIVLVRDTTLPSIRGKKRALRYNFNGLHSVMLLHFNIAIFIAVYHNYSLLHLSTILQTASVV
jgi:hypothetical protein